MLPLILLIAAAGLIEAKPNAMLRPTFGFSMHGIVGGTDANPGEFPWQLSLQRLGAAWSHSCGASLLGANRALSAAHYVDGASASILRVIAGLHRRSDPANAQSSNVTSYTMHEQYNQGSDTFANDIVIIRLATSITTEGDIDFAILAQGTHDFAGTTCVISGWGRTSSSNTLPDTLQKASIEVIGKVQCQNLVANIATIGDGHICLYDSNGITGSCNGDSGGPLNCPSGPATLVAGVTSWGISSLNICRQDYPSVYTRVSYYYDWIVSHMP